MQVTNTTGSLASVFQDVSVGDHKREGTILAINDVVTYRLFSNPNSIATIDICSFHRSCTLHKKKTSLDLLCPKCQKIVAVDKTYADYYGNLYLQASDNVINLKFFSSLFNMKHANEGGVEEKLGEDYTGKNAIVDFDGSLENESEAIAVRLQIKDA